MMSLVAERLVVQVQVGSELRDFGAWMTSEQRRVFLLCRRMLQDPDEADSATQDVFLKAYKAMTKEVLRAQGILNVKGDDRRLVFQAVHMILEGDFQRPWRDGETRSSRMVFIGRNLDEALLRVGFQSCAAA